MNSIFFATNPIRTLALTIFAACLIPNALAQQDLASQLNKMAGECRNARNDCFRDCLIPARNLERGIEVPEADIEACRVAYGKLNQQAEPVPTWTPEYASIPDVVGVFHGAIVVAQGRDDWKRHCRSSAIIGGLDAPTVWNVPKGATVKVSGVRYVTNPIKSFDRKKTACLADSVEVLSTP